jgi:FkbM family methyltransferase
MVELLAREGLERVINDTDRVLISPKYRGISEVYEPAVWHQLMQEVRPGDVVADVGAFIGMYTIALARRVGPTGKVLSFEPDPGNFAWLRKHVVLNGMSARVALIDAVVGASEGDVPFAIGRSLESRVADLVDTSKAANIEMVRSTTLDAALGESRLDLLKIDVEGYEQAVLQGAAGLFSDDTRKPRSVFVEVHPYAWSRIGTTSRSLLRLLEDSGYAPLTLSGERLKCIEEYGEIVARRIDP